jgi:DNA-binding NarL/FixJ family response regulator
VIEQTAEPAQQEAAHRVLLAHTYRGFAEALAERLGGEPDLEIVAICTDMKKVEVVLSLESIDVLLVDWRFDQPGTRKIRQVREQSPSIRVAIISDTDGATHAVAAARAGVLGWVQTSESVSRLCDVIRGMCRGEMWFPPSFVTAALGQLMRDREEQNAGQALIGTLTAREREILRCLLAGHTRSDIARELYISPDTVRTHVHNLLHRLGVHDSVAATAIARHAGLTPFTPSSEVPHWT